MDRRRVVVGTAVGRRELLRTGVGVVATASIAGCDLLATEPSGDAGREQRGRRDRKEAPALAARVEAGELPSMDQRLPERPMVVKPVGGTGIYGGTWRTAFLGPTDYNWLYRTIGYDQLMRWDLDFTEALPNLAEAVDVVDGGREFVVRLRRGVRWSDGEPFTAADLKFAYEDIVLNEELTPTVPAWLAMADEPARFEQVDELTVRVRFAAPSAFFVQTLASPDGEALAAAPRHYLEKFHVKYSPDAAGTAETDGYSNWAEWFLTKAGRWENAEIPTLGPWQVTSAIGDGARVTAERNPYYWKVDPDGRQLPYLDSIVFDLAQDEQVMLLKATNGEIDMQTRHINTLTNKPVLAKAREAGGYRLFDMISAWSNYMAFALNLTHKDPVKREIFTNKDFRIGLSYAIDRGELISTVFYRQGEPYQVAPRPESAFYHEQLAKQYTEFDLDLANRHLDKAGYTERDEQGFRLGPDGARIAFDVDVPIGAIGLVTADDVQFVSDYWHEVGIDMRVQAMDRSLFTERQEANEHDAAVIVGAQALADAILQPIPYLPYTSGFAAAVPWVNWYNGTPGPSEDPPDGPKRQLELYDQLQESMREDERAQLFQQILEITRDEFYFIGTVLPSGAYGIAKNNFHNVYEPMIEAFQYVTPGPSMPEQYYFSDT